MKKPSLKLVVDPKEDAEIGAGFIATEKDLKYWDWFLPEEIKCIINEKITLRKKQNKLLKYVKAYHLKHKKEIVKGCNEAKKNWKAIEDEYYLLVEKLFKNHPWPKGQYRGVVTIFKMYPRWIEGKLFSFPYSHSIDKFSNITIAHEMLHFIFFDYIEKKYGLTEKSKIKGKEHDYIWKVSEVFNNVILNSKPFQDVLKVKDDNYVDPPSMYVKMKKHWKQNNDIDWLLDKWLLEDKIV